MSDYIKYSVIIPVYNSEKTIGRCLESLASQDREDVQIIVVNDGSSDASEGLILGLAEKHPCIEYVYQKNAGVSRARNTGLERARGEYVTFVDSDDYVRGDYFSVLDRAEEGDLLVFCHEIIGDDPRDMGALFAELKQLGSPEQRLELLLSSRRIMSPWDKRFRRSLVEEHHIRFPEGMQIGEDFNFSLACAVRAETIGIEEAQIIYNDITGQDSLSRKYRPELDRQMEEAFTKAADTIRNSPLEPRRKERLLAISDYLFVKHTFSCISELYKVRDLRYFRDRDEIAGICRRFRRPLAEGRCGLLHRVFRLLLRCRIWFPFYLAARMRKRKAFLKQAEGNA